MVLRKSVHLSHLVLHPSHVHDRLRVEQVHASTANETPGLTSICALSQE